MQNNLNEYQVDLHFSSALYRIKKPEFISSVKHVFEEYVAISKEKNECPSPVYPCTMTSIISSDERIAPFVQYVSDAAWEILDSQGYDMRLFYTEASEMWGQHHPYMSSIEQHFHGSMSQLCGFYFLDTPPDSSKLFIHDPRDAKIYAGLPFKESETPILAHNMIYYTPEPGDLIFTNSWLAHSFNRNASKLPFNFIHINVKVVPRDDIACETNNPVIV